MKFPWLSKKPITDTELNEIADILFPMFLSEVDSSGRTIVTDRSADNVLQSCLYDIEDGVVDELVKESLKHIIGRLVKVREILGVEQKVHKVDVLRIESSYDTVRELVRDRG